MLFTPKLTVQNNDGSRTVLNRAGFLGQPVGVIPRSQCHFRQTRLKGEGRAAVLAAEMRARKEARAGDNRFRVMLGNDENHAGVWSYNASQETQYRTLPESLCYAPLGKGPRLIECLNGYEGQVWSNQTLVASRWWPSEPGDSQWQSFLRVAPYPFEDDLPTKPAPIAAPFRTDLPIFLIDKSRIKGLVSPARIATAATIVGIAATSFSVSQYAHYAASLKKVEGQKVEISQSARETLAKRRKALATVGSLQGYTNLNNEASLIASLHDIITVFESQDLLIRHIKLNDKGVEFTVEGTPDVTGPDLVRAVEATQTMTGVTITTERSGYLKINAVLETTDESAS